jgi:hypothetical protein
MDDRIEVLKWYGVYLLNKCYEEQIVLGEIYKQGSRKFGLSKANLGSCTSEKFLGQNAGILVYYYEGM